MLNIYGNQRESQNSIMRLLQDYKDGNLSSVSLLEELNQIFASSFSQNKRQTSTLQTVLENLPEILLTLFPVNSTVTGWTGEPLLHRIDHL